MTHTHDTRSFRTLPVLLLAVLAFVAAGASAQSAELLTLDIERQEAGSALVRLAKSSGIQIMLKGGAAKVEVEGLQGEYRLGEALAALLTGTGLTYEFTSENVVVVQQAADQEEGSADEKDDDAEAREEAEEEKLPEFKAQIVTGTRLTGLELQKPAQMIVISREDLDNSGAPTLEQALRQLPQNINGTTEFGGARLYGATDSSGRLLGTSNINGSSTINLRGLGESATLVLIDGKRTGDSGMLGGFTDISEIPMSIVERIEIQLDGSSSIYGSDAIGGVVNVILKEDYDLLTASLRRTSRTNGGPSEHNASVAAGTTWGSGSVLLNVDAYRASNQDVGQTDLNLLGINQYGYPGNVRGRRGNLSSPREISRSLSQTARNAGLIGADEQVTRVTIPTGQDGTGLTAENFLDSVGAYRTNDAGDLDISVIPKSERHTFRLVAKQKIADWLEVEGGLTYGARKSFSRSGDAVGDMTFEVAAENPYNPFGTDVEVDITVPGFGARVVSGDRDSLTFDLDLKGPVGQKWRWAIRSRLAERKSTAETLNFISHDGLNDLVDDTRADHSNALNVFGDSFHTDANNAAVLAGGNFHIPVQRSETTNRLASSELIVSGELFSLPAGEARAAAGLEWRKSSADVDYGTTFVRVIRPVAPIENNAISEGFALKGTRTLRAGFAEFFFPVLGPNNSVPGVRDLNVVLSGRHEAADGSSSAGIETNSRYLSNVWSAGLAYRPIQSVTLRTNKSTSYRAPDVAHALFPPLISPARIFDLRTGGFRRTNIERISGGNPILQPEESTSLTWGIEIAPVSLEGLTFSVDFHKTLFRNRIARPNILGGIFVTDLTFDRFGFQYSLDEEGRITSFDSRSTNIAVVDTRGSDYRLRYEFEAGGNKLGLSASVAITNNFIQDINTFDLEEALEHVGLYIPKRIYRVAVFWRRGGLYLGLNARSRSSLTYTRLRSISLEPSENEILEVQVRTEPATIVDFRGTFNVSESWRSAPRILKNVVLAFGLNNIFDSFDKTVMDPEPFDGYLGIPRGVNDSRGQMYYLEFSKEF